MDALISLLCTCVYYIGEILMVLYAVLSFSHESTFALEQAWCVQHPKEYTERNSKSNKLAAHSRLYLNWNHCPTVGQKFKISIQLFKNDFKKGTQPHTLTKNDKVVINIVNRVEEFEVPYQNEKNENPKQDNEITYSFFTRKAGIYYIYVYINDEKMFVCPIEKHFLPERKMNFDKTFIHCGWAPFLCTSGNKTCKIVVKPRDQFGNRFNKNDIDFLKFSWKLNHENLRSLQKPSKFSNYIHSRIPLGKDVIISFQIFEPGIFHGQLLYSETSLGLNGEFQIVCITDKEDEEIVKAINDRLTHPIEYHAKLLLNQTSFELNIGILNDAVQGSVNNCTLNLTSNQVKIVVTTSTIYIKDHHSKKIKYVIRIAEGSKIRVLNTNSVTDIGTFEISSAESAEVSIYLEMPTVQLRKLMTMHSILLLRATSGFDSFLDHHNAFCKKMQSIKEEAIVKVDLPSKENIFKNMFKYHEQFSSNDWKKVFIVTFSGEHLAYDISRRMMFEVIFQELFKVTKSQNGVYKGLFVPKGEYKLIHPNIQGNIVTNNLSVHCKCWELIGKIFGKCIFDSSSGEIAPILINARFTRSFLSIMLAIPPNYKHFKKDDPVFYREKVIPILTEDVTYKNLYFVDDYSEMRLFSSRKLELIPNGSQIRVTNENKIKYLNHLARFWFVKRIRNEIHWFLQGLYSIIPPDDLSILNESELELLACGASHYTVKEMLGGESAYLDFSDTKQKILSWFTQAVEEMSEDNKGRLLQFTTGSSLLPHGGFSQLEPSFFVQIIIDEHYKGMPTVDETRANSICLRNHPNYESFQKSLLVAINGGSSAYESM